MGLRALRSASVRRALARRVGANGVGSGVRASLRAWVRVSAPATVLATALATSVAAGTPSDDEACGPFDGPVAFAQLDAATEPGVAPASGPPGAGGAGGRIVPLPGSSGARPPGQVAGEALLAVPKGDGSGPSFTLAPTAHVVDSYFSPVLCSTVVRVAGAKDARPQDLVVDYPAVAALVPNHVYATAQAEVRPLDAGAQRGPDPYRPLQWGMDRLGIDRARALSNGAGARVAVLDSAPQSDHRDLRTIRPVLVEGGPTAAPGVHGTLVTGIVAAIEDNAFGIAGVAPGARLVPIAVCTPAGASATDECPLYTVLKGLDRAWEERADVVNLSIVGPDNPLLERGMNRLEELGAVVVAAAGNEATDEPRYPAAYASVVGVGAIDPSGALYARSNRGLSSEILAPGVDVLSTVPGDAFSFGSGTSFAAAHVAGELAIVVGAGVAPADARTALFRAASASGGPARTPAAPPVCDVLARLGRACAPD